MLLPFYKRERIGNLDQPSAEDNYAEDNYESWIKQWKISSWRYQSTTEVTKSHQGNIYGKLETQQSQPALGATFDLRVLHLDLSDAFGGSLVLTKVNPSGL